MIKETKQFKGEYTKGLLHCYPTIQVTVISHWDGKKSVNKAYFSYFIIGENMNINAYNKICRDFPEVFFKAEDWCADNNYIIEYCN
jgi:hypothetical protein